MKLRAGISAIVVCGLFLSSAKSSSADSIDLQKTLDSHKLIGLSEAKSLNLTGEGQTIVFIDDGHQVNHPYLQGTMIDGFCTSSEVCGADYMVSGIKSGGAHRGDGTHGSMVAGIIAGQANTLAPGGIAPKAKLISIDNNSGQGEGLIRAMDWILSVHKKHNIIALSGSFAAPNFGGARGGGGECSIDPTLSRRIQSLVEAGISVVFAAGNGGSLSKLDYPACLSEVISVGALKSTGEIQDYSNISNAITVLAPADVISANGSSSYFIGGGTSSAAPVVAGAIALLKQANPSATPQEIKKALQSTRYRATDVLWGNLPILDLPTAIEAIRTGKFDTQSITANSGKPSPAPTVTVPVPGPTATVTMTPSPQPTKVVVLTRINCTKSKKTRVVTAVNPKCPKGYKEK